MLAFSDKWLSSSAWPGTDHPRNIWRIIDLAMDRLSNKETAALRWQGAVFIMGADVLNHDTSDVASDLTPFMDWGDGDFSVPTVQTQNGNNLNRTGNNNKVRAEQLRCGCVRSVQKHPSNRSNHRLNGSFTAALCLRVGSFAARLLCSLQPAAQVLSGVAVTHVMAHCTVNKHGALAQQKLITLLYTFMSRATC